MHTLSLAYLTVQGCPPLDHIRIAAETGYDAVGLRIIAPLGLELAHPIVGHPALVREITRTSADHGISFLDGEVFTLRPDTRVEDWFPTLDVAAELGMALMQITSEDPELSRAAENLGRIADRAAGAGIDMAIEFMRWRSAATIADASHLAAASGRSNVGLLLDALHLSRSGGSPEAVAACAAQVLYVQLCDAPILQPRTDAETIAEARGGRLLPGKGGLWLHPLLDLLPADIPISVETPGVNDVALDFTERASRGMEATRQFLSARR